MKDSTKVEQSLDRRKKKEAERLDMIKSYKELFGTELGQKVLEDIVIKSCKIDVPALVGSDIGSIMFREGQRSVGLALLKVLDKDETEIMDFIRTASVRNQLAVREVRDFITGDN